MPSKWFTFVITGFFLINANLAMSQKRNQIEYQGKTPEGLVGNGRSVVKVRPTGFEFHTGGDATGQFSFIVNGKPREFNISKAHSEFFPGGVVYRLADDGMNIEILHGAETDNPYFAVIRVKGKAKSVEMDVNTHGSPHVSPSGRITIELKHGIGQICLSVGPTIPSGTLDEIKIKAEASYQKGFLLHTPSKLVDRAVPFNRYLLDLGFDGNLHVCEIFRWRDVWSRDLGSGLVPGAMAGGEFSAARTTIEYDLHR